MSGRRGGDIWKSGKPRKLPAQVPAMTVLRQMVNALDRMTEPPSKRREREAKDHETVANSNPATAKLYHDLLTEIQEKSTQ